MNPTTTAFSQSYKINGPFAAVNDTMQEIMEALTPGAASLFLWLRRQGRPFTEIEVNLKDYIDKYDYGLPWIKKCYQELIDHGLWQENYRWYGGREYRGIVMDPSLVSTTVNRSTPQNQEEKIFTPPEKSNLTASNPDSASPLKEVLKDLKETRTLPPPVLKQEKAENANKAEEMVEEPTQKAEFQKSETLVLDVSFANLQEPEAQTPVLTAPAIDLDEFNPSLRVKDGPVVLTHALVEMAYMQLGVRVTQAIYSLILISSLGVVVNAIAAVKQQLDLQTVNNNPVKSKEGLFITALKRRFKPNQPPQTTLKGIEDKNVAPEGFKEWFDAASAARLVLGSTMKDGEMWLYLYCGTAMAKWKDLMVKYPDLLAPQVVPPIPQVALPIPQVAPPVPQVALPVPQKPEHDQKPLQSQQQSLQPPQKQREMPKLKVQSPSRQAVKRPQPVDLSDVIAEISLHIKRLGWQEPELRSHLHETYGKRTRQQLSDSELFHLQDWLKTQVSQVEQAVNLWTNGGSGPMPAT